MQNGQDSQKVNYTIEGGLIKIEAPVDKASILFDQKTETMVVICSAKNHLTSLGLLEQAKQELHDYRTWQIVEQRKSQAIKQKLLEK